MKKVSKVWMHNSFFGCVAMAQKNMRRIVVASTPNKAAKELARKIDWDLAMLAKLLKDRVDAN